MCCQSYCTEYNVTRRQKKNIRISKKKNRNEVVRRKQDWTKQTNGNINRQRRLCWFDHAKEQEVTGFEQKQKRCYIVHWTKSKRRLTFLFWYFYGNIRKFRMGIGATEEAHTWRFDAISLSASRRQTDKTCYSASSWYFRQTHHRSAHLRRLTFKHFAELAESYSITVKFMHWTES